MSKDNSKLFDKWLSPNKFNCRLLINRLPQLAICIASRRNASTCLQVANGLVIQLAGLSGPDTCKYSTDGVVFNISVFCTAVLTGIIDYRSRLA